MDINFEKPSLLNSEDIIMIEAKISIQLPSYLINFFTKYSNSIPSYNSNPCEFKVYHPDGRTIGYMWIEKIVGLEGIFAEFDDRETLELFIREQNLSKDFVEIEYLCPFAYAPNGVLYCSIAGLHSGKIYFADNGDFGLLFVRNNFEEFWNSVDGS